MLYTDLTNKAMRLCYEAHKGQYDKSGVPYIFHPIHLAEQLEDERDICVALLHDVIEDTEYTIDDIVECGFPGEVIEAIKILTRDKSIDYMDYIALVKENDIAKRVKLKDLEHNSDPTRLANIKDTEKRAVLSERYEKAKKYLTENM